MKMETHGPYDQMNVEAKATSVTSLVAEGYGTIKELHNSIDSLYARLETVINRADSDGETESVDPMPPSTSLMCGELLKLNDGIDSAVRRVNMLMARLEL